MKVTARSKPRATPAATRDERPNGSPRPEDIAMAAYYRAERRGFAPGHEIEDWLAAERELAQPPARLS